MSLRIELDGGSQTAFTCLDFISGKVVLNLPYEDTGNLENQSRLRGEGRLGESHLLTGSSVVHNRQAGGRIPDQAGASANRDPRRPIQGQTAARSRDTQSKQTRPLAPALSSCLSRALVTKRGRSSTWSKLYFRRKLLGKTPYRVWDLRSEVANTNTLSRSGSPSIRPAPTAWPVRGPSPAVSSRE